VVRTACALASLALAFALAAPARAGDAGLAVRIGLDRERVFVHEQAVLSVVVHHPSDARASWEPPPFDGFWAERLSTRGLPPDDAGRLRTEFRRALFATRTGELAIAASKLVLVGEGGAEREIAVPATRIRVDALPAGVPREALVGQLSVQVLASDDRLRLGKALSLTIELVGEGNVWDAPPPALEPLLGPDVEVFPEPARLSIGESAGRATTRRSFRYALVPAHTGRFRLESVRFPYFDPKAGALAEAASDPLAFAVFEGSAGVEERAPWESQPPTAPESPLHLGALVLFALAAVGGSFLYLARWRRAQLRLLLGPAAPAPRAAFDAARAATDRGERHRLLARAVRTGIHARHHFDALPLTTAEIAARLDDREALELLHALDRARFTGRDLGDDDGLVERVRAYLRL
jgi:hypothetical protein